MEGNMKNTYETSSYSNLVTQSKRSSNNRGGDERDLSLGPTPWAAVSSAPASFFGATSSRCHGAGGGGVLSTATSASCGERDLGDRPRTSHAPVSCGAYAPALWAVDFDFVDGGGADPGGGALEMIAGLGERRS